MILRILCILTVLAFAGQIRADDAAAQKAKDIAQMQKIWEALQAYKKAKGNLPKQLSDLVSDYLADKAILVSPKGAEGKINNPDTADQKLPCSYGYEFAGEGKGSFKEFKMKQMEEYGEIVPLIRCFLYDKVVSISYGGEVYESELYWEKSEFVKDWLTKHKIEPGAKNGEQLLITVVGSDEKPIDGVVVKATERTTGAFDLPDRTVTTGVDGTARLPIAKGNDAGARLSFEKAGLATLPRYWPIRDNDGNVDPAAKPVLRVVMFKGGTATGVIRGQDGKPVSGARVWLTPFDDKAEQSRGQNLVFPKATAEDGRWEIKEVPSGGVYKMTVNHPAHRFFFQRLGENGAPTLEAILAGKGDITLLSPYIITGSVTVGEKPVSGATVWMASGTGYPVSSASTGADGAFKVAWMQEPKGQLVVFTKGHAPRKFPVESAEKPVQAPLERGRAMKGRVRDQAGDPVPNVPILLSRFENIYLRVDMPVIAMSDAEGNFEWADAPNAVISVVALLPSGAQWNFQWDCSKDKPAEIKVPVQPE